jgi:CBS domain-containing protein
MAAQLVREVMTPNPVKVPKSGSVAEAARIMLGADIGDVLVTDGDRMVGVLTDRDIVVRAVALDLDPDETTVGAICSAEVTSISPNAPVDEAVRLMRREAIRRLPVVSDGRLVGLVSLGDLALERDPDSALADISAAAPNR